MSWCVAACCIVLQGGAVVLQCVAVVLQCVAVYFGVLQRVASCCMFCSSDDIPCLFELHTVSLIICDLV